MNKTYNKKENIFLSFLLVCLILFNTSCGLDTYYVIDPPTLVTNEPIYSSIDPSSWYFEFYTTENDYEGIKFLGTEVYYKIYRNSSRMESEYKTIVATANNIETSSSAADKLINNYKYKPLGAYGNYSQSVLIPSAGMNRLVHIRLSDYPPYQAQILVGGANIYNSSSIVIPVRNISRTGDNSFNFKNMDSSLRPKKGDEDVDYSGSGSDSIWYVAMFAVEVGQDSTYSTINSNVLFLGSVTISAE